VLLAGIVKFGSPPFRKVLAKAGLSQGMFAHATPYDSVDRNMQNGCKSVAPKHIIVEFQI